MRNFSNPDHAANLKHFQEQVSTARRQAGRLQKDLAAALSVDAQVLSRKLHGSGRDQLTHYEVKQIIKTLAAWDAITAQAEAVELLTLMRLKQESFSPEEWNSTPLSRLDKQPPDKSVVRGAASYVTSTGNRGQSTLPTPSTSLIGREWAIKLVCELVQQDEVRLLTLLGAGGVGKTRLSLAIAATLKDEFADGVFFVSLGDIREAALVPSTIAQALDLLEPLRGTAFPHASPSYEHILKNFLCEKEVLLVLDNFEHLLDATIFIGELLEAVPHLKLLVTSRATLPLNGGYEFGVPPLEVPDPTLATNPAVLAQSPAIRLFVERVKAVNPRFALTEQNASFVLQLCLRLEGLPLAIELAAARSRLLSPQAVLERLGKGDAGAQHGEVGLSLTFLRQQARNVPVRQQTLLHTLDWSYHLLDIQAQRLFRRLGVFTGGWTLQAALVVCQDEDHQIGAEDLFEQLEGLVNQSLVVPLEERSPDEETVQRFRFLQPLHEYAWKQLQESGEGGVRQQQHASYYLDLVEQIEPELVGNRRRRAIQSLIREQDNIRTALAWAIEHEEAELAQRFYGALGLFWESQSQFQETHSSLQAVLRMGEHTPIEVRAKLALAAARLTNWEMALEHSREFAQEALSLYEACGDTRGKANALFQIGDAWYFQGEYTQATEYLQRALKLQRDLGELRSTALTLSRLGAISTLQGDFDRAESDLTEAVTFFRQSGESWVLSGALNSLGVLAVLQGKLHQALSLMREAMLLAQETRQRYTLALTLISLGCALGVASDARYAALICSMAEALFEQTTSALPPAYRPLYIGYLMSIKARVNEGTWETEWAQGRRLSSEQAVALALEGCQQVLS